MGSGPLSGLRVLELASIGPGPFAAMVLADLGADVVRVDRTSGGVERRELLNRGRRSVAVDLRRPEGVDLVLDLAAGSDVLLEGFRPGVAERLGVGPDACRARNPGLVYGRVTGWGQDGPLAAAAGHDINYVALSGILDACGRAGQPPSVPLNVAGDFGGGGMLAVVGVLAALWERSRSGEGQMVDAAMVDGAALLAATFYPLAAKGLLGPRGTNLIDSGAPFYDAYECADGRYVSVGAMEPQFYALLREATGLTGPDWDDQDDRSRWPERKEQIAAVFRTRPSAEWCERLEGSDVCFAPVVTFAEAPEHPHHRHRGTYATHRGMVQPSPAPRLSRTPGGLDRPPALPGEHTVEVLRSYAVPDDVIEALLAGGVVVQRGSDPRGGRPAGEDRGVT